MLRQTSLCCASALGTRLRVSLALTVCLLSSIPAAAQTTFTDDPIVIGVMPIKVVHVMEMCARIDALRQRANLAPFTWTDPTITAGVTLVRAVHLQELRGALSTAI